MASDIKERVRLAKMEIESLPLWLQTYVKGLRRFMQKIDLHNELFKDLKVAKSLNNWVDECVDAVKQTESLIEKALENKIHHEDFEDEMIDMARYLESLLDSSPSYDELYFENVPVELAERLDEISTLFDRVYDGLRKEGYELYNVLIGSEIL